MKGRTSLNAKPSGGVITNVIALALVYALFGTSVLQASAGIHVVGSGQEEPAKKPTLQERILQVPQGTMIEVRLLNKHRVRGRLGEISSEGFSLQTAQENKVETQKIAFTDVKSIKQLEGTTGKKVGKGLIYALAGIGALTVVLVIWAASRED